jgi:hypothetical protein
MRKITFLLLIGISLVSNVFTNAQTVADYVFNQTAGTYTPITGGTSILAAANDDTESALTNIGFTFVYHGANFTQFSASPNGYICLGAVPSSTTTPLSTTTNCIAFAATDGETNTDVTYLVSGTAPNRVFTIQYPNWYLYWGGTTEQLNAQIKLYETTNVIEIIYGSSLHTTAYSPQAGLSGAAVTDYSIRTTATNWSASAAATSNSATMTWSATVFPANGLKYTWTPSTCISPSTLAAASITMTSASLSWTSTGTLFNIQYGPTGFTLGTGTIVTSASSPYALSGLTASSGYSFYVQNDCGGGTTSNWTGPFNFTTSCGAITQPYSQNFDGVTVPALPACWSKIVVATGSPSVTTVTTTPSTAPNCAQLFNSTSSGSSTHVLLISPQLSDLPAHTTQIRFKAKFSGSGSPLLHIGTMSDPAVQTTFTTFQSIMSLTTTWQEFVIPFNSYGGVNQYIAFKHGYGSTLQYIYIDDVVYETIPTCPQPSALAATSITDVSASLNWASNGTETLWNVQWGTQGFTLGTGTMINGLTAHPYSLTGLTATTNYSFYVQADCGGGDISAWSGPYSFATICGVISTLPWTESLTTYLPNCWSETNGQLLATSTLTGTTSNWIADGYANVGTSGAARLLISSTALYGWLMTPQINIGSGATPYQLEFDLALTASGGTGNPGLTGTDDKFAVVISTDGGTTWTNVNTIRQWDNAGSLFVYNALTPAGTHIIIPLTSYTGVVKIGFYGESTVTNASNDLFIDNVRIIQQPSCPQPAALTASGITSNSAILNWINGNTETSWDIQYGPTGFVLGTGTIINNITTKPYTLSGLSGFTSYQYYLLAQCSPTDSSLWTGPYSFTTLITSCSGVPVPGIVQSNVNPICPGTNFNLWLTGNDGGTTFQWQSSTDGITFINIASATNDTITTSQSVTTYYHCIVSCTASGFSDTTSVYTENLSPFQNCYCTSNATSTADEEILNVTIGTLNNSSTCSTTGGPGSILNQYSNYTAVAAPNLSKTIALPFSVQIGTCGGNWSNGIAIWIDYNQNGLYTDAGEKVYFSPTTTSGAHTETGTITVPVSATLGLTGMRVISSESSVPTSPCGTYTWGETEDYVVNISAPPTCMQPTALNVSTILNTSVVLGWTAGGTETAWDIQYGPTGFTLGTGTFVNNVTTNPYTLTGLTATTAYQYYVHANCGPTDSSFWSGPIAFTTIATVCSGTPTAGTAQSSVAQVCSSINFTLWVTGQTVGGGVTYQWQSSADGITFANIAGATNDTITATQTATSYYQCIVTCPVSALSATSTVVNVTLNPFSNCYCTSNATSTIDEEILNVTAGTLNNSSTCATTGGPGSILNQYSDYSAITPPTFAQTSSTSFSVTVGTCGTTNYNSGLAIFIDLNHNGLFTDAGEKVYSNGALSNITCVPLTIVSGSFTIPITSMLGNTRMRIVDAESTSGDAIVPCGTYGYGETEDYIINIVGPPSCMQPTTLTATAITGNSATLGWTAGSTETAWDIQYGVSGFALGTGTILNNITANTYALTGLLTSTNYQYYVLAQCTPTDSSMWTGPFSFTTLCGIFNAPFAEHFNTTTIPNCWSMAGPQVWLFNTTWPNYGAQSLIEHTGNAGSFAGVDGSATVSLTDINLLTPFINTSALTVPQLRFFLFNNNIDNADYQTLTVDVFDGTTWHNGMFVWGPTQNNASWQEITVPLNTLTITGPIQIRFVVAKGTGFPYYDDIIIDDVFVEEAPTCPKPTALTATTITMNSAILGWTLGNAETAWDIQYGIAGFALGTGTIINNVTTNPYTLTGLNPSSAYQFYILAQCSGTDSSMWTGPISFSTLCGPVTPTYYEPFVTFLPNCWTEGQGALAAPVTFTTTVTSNWNADGFGNIGSTGAAGVNIYSTARYDWLISPEIDLGATPGVYQLDFNLALTAYASNAAPDLTGTDDKFAVVISTDGGLTWSSANTLKLWDNAGSPDVYNTIPTTGTHVIIPLTGYTGIVKFGFYGESTASNADNDLFIDNVRIRRPLDLTITYPTDGTHNECGLSASEILSICVKNVSPATVNAGQNIYAWYKVDLNTAVKDTITLTSNLLPNDSICFNFTQTHNFSVQTTYLVNYWINYSEDSNNSNDTTNTAIVNGTLSVAIQGGDTVLIDPQFIPWELSAQLTAQTYDTYLWSNFDGSVTGTTAVFLAPALGWYYLTVTGSGCSASDSVFLDNILSTTINSLNQGIRVFPNPTDGKFIVEITAKNSSNYKLELISSDGRIVSTKNYSNTNQIRIVYDETNLAEGIYYLKINGDGKQQIEKVVIY